jgi:hypothetical protein
MSSIIIYTQNLRITTIVTVNIIAFGKSPPHPALSPSGEGKKDKKRPERLLSPAFVFQFLVKGNFYS